MPSHVLLNASSGILSRSVHPAKLVLRGMLMLQALYLTSDI